LTRKRFFGGAAELLVFNLVKFDSTFITIHPDELLSNLRQNQIKFQLHFVVFQGENSNVFSPLLVYPRRLGDKKDSQFSNQVNNIKKK
jgi:hypothetical protein